MYMNFLQLVIITFLSLASISPVVKGSINFAGIEDKWTESVKGDENFAQVTFKVANFTATGNKDVVFSLYSRDSLKVADSRPVYILVHGWTGSKKGFPDWLKLMRQALLQKENSLVIEVDWTVYSQFIDYNKSRAKVPLVGGKVKDYIYKLLAKQNPGRPSIKDTSQVTCIGHSLGAHVCGFFGKNVLQQGLEVIKRISGLDPAGPGYTQAAVKDRLATTDAAIVDVILTSKTLGIYQPIGHFNYFPNFGDKLQPGCYTFVCNHARPVEYYLDSVRKPECFKTYTRCATFTGGKLKNCSSWSASRMGWMDKYAQGWPIYNVKISKKQAPFCNI